MEISLKMDNNHVVIIDETCYIYTSDGTTDEYLEWEDAPPDFRERVESFVNKINELNVDQLFFGDGMMPG